MGSTRHAVIRGIEEFLAETHLGEQRFGKQAVGDTKLMRRLRAGEGVTLTTIERAETYIAECRQKLAA